MSTLSSTAISHALRNLVNPRVVVSADEASPDLVTQVPGLWLELLSLDGVAIDTLQDMWQPVRARIPETMEEMEATLQGLAILVEDEQLPSLLYVFLDKEGDLSFYRGFPPLRNDRIPPDVLPVWPQLPRDFRELYAVHDGWYLVHSHSGGHLPVRRWSFLSSDEWLLENRLVERMPISPERTLVVYRHGGGGYLGFELPPLTDPGPARPVEIWARDLPDVETDVEFWEVFDAWTVPSFLDKVWRV